MQAHISRDSLNDAIKKLKIGVEALKKADGENIFGKPYDYTAHIIDISSFISDLEGILFKHDQYINSGEAFQDEREGELLKAADWRNDD